MGVASWLGIENNANCIICGGCHPKEDAVIETSGLCICDSCWNKIEEYRTPSAFMGNKYMNCYICGYPYSGVLKEAYTQYKFSSQRRYAKVFAEIIFKVSNHFIKEDDFDQVIPVPISQKRMTERGYNQVEMIAEEIAKRLSLEYSDKALFRIKDTKRQSGLSAKERSKNVEGAFLADRWRVKGKKILLVDDIYTRGATISECAKVLKESGAQLVVGITLFRSEVREEKTEYEFFQELNF